MFDPEKEIKKMKNYLTERTDYEVLRGYKEAKADYEKDESPYVKSALDYIQEEMDRRGITEADYEKAKAIAKEEHDRNQMQS